MNLPFIISILSHLPIYATTLYAIFHYKKLPKPLKIFTHFLISTSIIQFASLLLALQSINNLPLLHLYVLVSMAMLGWFYNEILHKFINKKIIWAITILFSIISISNTLFIQKIYTFASNALTLESIVIIVLSLSTFILFMNESVKENNRNLAGSIYWINTGLFLYYTSNLLIYYFGNIIIHSLSQKVNMYTWALHSFFSMVMYGCFYLGLWIHPKD